MFILGLFIGTILGFTLMALISNNKCINCTYNENEVYCDENEVYYED